MKRSGLVIPVFVTASLLFLVVVSHGVLAASGVPKILSYQGQLLNVDGDPLGGSSGANYCFKFSIYDDATVGSPDTKIWPAENPSVMTVNVKNGVFSAAIGDTSAGGNALDYDFQTNDTNYLNVEVAAQVGGSCSGASFENLAPRQRILSSGFAINASTVGGFTPSQSASGSQIPVLSSGNLTLGGTNPQIGTTGSNNLVLSPGGAVVLTGLNCSSFANGGVLTATATGTIVCADDDTGTAGGGITSLNGSTSSTQTFSVSGAPGLTITTVNGVHKFSVATSSASATGFLSAADWATFNAKITTSSLSSTATGLTYTSNTGVFSLTAGYEIPTTASTSAWNAKQGPITMATSGSANITIASSSGTWTIQQATSSATSNGFLSSADWSTFSGKQTPITIATSGLTGLSIASSSGTWTFSIATSSATQSGFLSSANWATFNAKITTTSLSAVAPLAYNSQTGAFSFSGSFASSGAANITIASSSGTWTFQQATSSASVSGYLSSADWANFASKATSSLTISAGLGMTGGGDLTASRTLTLNMAGGTCPAGSHVFALNATGTIVCTTDASGTGLTSLNGSTSSSQTFATTGATGGFSVATANGVHTFTIATSSASATGLLSSADWSTFNTKITTSSLSSTATGLTYTSNTGVFSLTSGYEIPKTASTSVWNAKQSALTVVAPLSLVGTTLSMPTSTASQNGFLLATDWASFNAKITTSSLSATNPITYNNVTGVIGWTNSNGYITTTSLSVVSPLAYNGTTGIFSMPTSTSGQSGYLSSADWTIFNNKQNAISFPIGYASTTGVQASLSFPLAYASTTHLTATAPLSISNGILSLPTSTASQSGFLSSANWATFNAKITTSSLSASLPIVYNNTTGAFTWQNSLGYITTTTLSAVAPLSYNNTTGAFSMPTSTASQNGFLLATDWNTFNNKQAAITLATSTSYSYNSFTIVSSSPTWTINVPKDLNDIAAITTSTGSIIVGAPAGWSALTVGTNGKVLTASSTATGGVSWETVSAPPGSGISSLNGLNAASQTFVVSTNYGGFTIASADSTHTFNFPGRLDDINDLTTTTGNLIIGNGTTWTALAPGANGKVLMASSTATGGLSWETISGGDAGYGVEDVEYFTSNGTWTRPGTYVNKVFVEVWGGGGAGGTGGANVSDGGGGGGGYSAGLVTVTGNVTVTVGTGGASEGASGATSTFAGATTPTARGGLGTATTTVAAGGTATGGTVNLSGQAGGVGLPGDGGRSGDGGSSPMGGTGGKGRGGGNVAGGTGLNGGAGQVPGGGGGGGAESNGTFGAGANGLVVVWEFSGTTGSDVAEWYETESDVEVGDVVAISESSLTYQSEWGLQNISILERAGPESRVVGVVSVAPQIVMGKAIEESAQNPQPIALAGRTPVKVSLENGEIKAGDLLGPSSMPGVAAKTEKAGMFIGWALEDYKPPEDGSIGKVLMFVHTGYSSGARSKVLLERAGVNVDEIPASFDMGRVILAHLLTQKKNITASSTLSEISTDRLMAGLEIISPRVLTDTLVVNTIEPLEKNIALKLIEGGKLTLESADQLSLSFTNTSSTLQAASSTLVVSFDSLGNAFFSGGLTVGNRNKPSGITLYDTETKEPYCMKITRGSLVNIPGECVSLPDFIKAQENPEAQSSEPSESSESLAPSEPSEPSESLAPSEPLEPSKPSEANPELGENEGVVEENPADEPTEPAGTTELIEQSESVEQPGTPPSEIVTEPVEAPSEPQPTEPIPETLPSDLTP